MELQIGTQIRKLRRLRNLTQEAVATHLGISFQAISKWERGDGYPDITLLPALASYFKTSIDDLMGMQEVVLQERYNEINRCWAVNNANGRHSENTSLMKEALKDYPNDALLLVQLSTSLEKINGPDQERHKNLLESAAVQEQILCYSQDSEIRGATQFNICFTYQKLGEYAKAISQAKKLPNLYKAKENALVSLKGIPDKIHIATAALEPLRWAIQLHLNTLANETHDTTYSKQAEVICSMLSDIQQNLETKAQ